MSNLTDDIKSMISALKDMEVGIPSMEKAPQYGRTSNYWKQILCMIEGDYTPSIKDKFDWYHSSNTVLELSAIALESIKMFPEEKESDTEDGLTLWTELYKSAHAVSSELLRSMK